MYIYIYICLSIYLSISLYYIYIISRRLHKCSVGQPSTSCASKPSPGTGGSHGLLPVAMTSSSYWTLLDWAPRALQRPGRPQGTGDDLGMVKKIMALGESHMLFFVNIQHSHIHSYTFIFIHIHSYNYINDDEWDDEHLPSGNQYIGGDSWGLNGVCIYIYIYITEGR